MAPVLESAILSASWSARWTADSTLVDSRGHLMELSKAQQSMAISMAALKGNEMVLMSLEPWSDSSTVIWMVSKSKGNEKARMSTENGKV